jgi:hypothetical protein
MKTAYRTLFIAVVASFLSISKAPLYGQEIVSIGQRNDYKANREQQLWETESESAEESFTAISTSSFAWGIFLALGIIIVTLLATNHTHHDQATPPSP